MIYFVEASRVKCIKIGYVAVDPDSRLSELQVGCPLELVRVGLMDGDIAEEKSLHRRFGKLRVRGEWFRGRPPLRDFIEENCREWPSPNAVRVEANRRAYELDMALVYCAGDAEAEQRVCNAWPNIKGMRIELRSPLPRRIDALVRSGACQITEREIVMQSHGCRFAVRRPDVPPEVPDIRPGPPGRAQKQEPPGWEMLPPGRRKNSFDLKKLRSPR